MTQTILITGATGAIGPRVVHALDQAEFSIRSFSVDTPVAGVFPQDVQVLIGDLCITTISLPGPLIDNDNLRRLF
jgi:nucleoside-diphosphate-sugar epimerase